jgi:hypothetical protein
VRGVCTARRAGIGRRLADLAEGAGATKVGGAHVLLWRLHVG